jgi:hypothetical protein
VGEVGAVDQDRAEAGGGVSLVRFVAKNHPQQSLWHGPRPQVDDRATNPELFAELNDRFRFNPGSVASAPMSAHRSAVVW